MFVVLDGTLFVKTIVILCIEIKAVYIKNKTILCRKTIIYI